jgi:signal transduction histidine kinase
LKKEIQVITHLVPVMVFGDRNMVNTILRNLLSNAMKYSRPGGEVEVHITVTDSFVNVLVTDSGIGMSPEMVEEFVRTGSLHSRRGTDGERGTGLGLAICRDFIERHGSHLEVESTQDVGSSFRFSLPLAVGDIGK